MATIHFGGHCTSASFSVERGNSITIYTNNSAIFDNSNCKYIYISPVIIILLLFILLLSIILISCCIYRRRQRNRTKTTMVQLQENENYHC
jgi:hypothetical protein